MTTTRRTGTRVDCTLTEAQHAEARALRIDPVLPLLYQDIPNAVPFWERISAENGVEFLTTNWPDIESPDFTGVVK